MGNLFRGNTAFKIAVADFIPTRHVGKGDGKVPFAVVGEVRFTAFSFRQYNVYSPFLQIGEQGRRINTYNVQLLYT